MNNQYILFSGNLPRTIRTHLHEWESLFVEKYGASSVVHLPIESTDKKTFLNELSNPPFLVEKRLIILSWAGNDVLEQKETEKKVRDILPIITEQLSHISENTIILAFQIDHPLFSELKKHFLSGEIHLFQVESRNDRIQFAKSKLPKTPDTLITLFVDRIGDDSIRFENELEKFMLLSDFNETTICSHIEENVESSVFRLQDSLYTLSQKQAIWELENIVKNGDLQRSFRTLLSQFRASCYFWLLREQWLSKQEAANLLDIKSFSAEKAERVTPETRKKLIRFWDDLIRIDHFEKIWKLIWEGEEALIFALERAIFALK